MLVLKEAYKIDADSAFNNPEWKRVKNVTWEDMFTFAEEVIIKNADQFGTQSNRGGWQLTLMQKAIEKAGFGRFLPRERGALASIIAKSLAAEIKRALETQFDD